MELAAAVDKASGRAARRAVAPGLAGHVQSLTVAIGEQLRTDWLKRRICITCSICIGSYYSPINMPDMILGADIVLGPSGISAGD